MKLYGLETQPVQDTNEITFVILRVFEVTHCCSIAHLFTLVPNTRYFSGSLKWKLKFASAILGSSAIQLYLGESIAAIQ